MTSGENPLKKGLDINILLCWEGLLGKSSFPVSQELVRLGDCCRLSWEGRALSCLGSSVLCVRFILAQTLQALSIALARHGFGESSKGEQAFGDIFVHEAICLIYLFSSNKMEQRYLIL